MRIVTVGTAILGIGILAALPFRHGGGQAVESAARAANAAPQPSVAPLQEVPLEQFAQQQYWPVAAQQTRITASAEQAIAAQLPPLPASYTDVAVPLATPQIIADRYSAAAPLRGGWSQDRPSAGGLAAAGAQPDPWQRGLPLGQPLDQPSAPLLAQTEVPAERQPAEAADHARAAGGDDLPWPSPEEVARAAQTQAAPAPQPDEAPPPQRMTVAKPAAHAITALDSDAASERSSQTENERPRFYIREPR